MASASCSYQFYISTIIELLAMSRSRGFIRSCWKSDGPFIGGIPVDGPFLFLSFHGVPPLEPFGFCFVHCFCYSMLSFFRSPHCFLKSLCCFFRLWHSLFHSRYSLF